MKKRFFIFCMVVASCFPYSAYAVDGVDVFATTQSFTVESVNVECTARFEAPWNDVYAWKLGLLSWFWVKVGKEYTGEFYYTGTDCTAFNEYYDTVQQTSVVKTVNFSVDSTGRVAVDSVGNIDFDLSSSENLAENVEALKLLVSLSLFTYDVVDNDSVPLVTAIVKTIQGKLTFGSLANAIAIEWAAYVFVSYFEQDEIREEISRIVNTVVATDLKESVTNAANNFYVAHVAYINTRNYLVSMPAINMVILN